MRPRPRLLGAGDSLGVRSGHHAACQSRNGQGFTAQPRGQDARHEDTRKGAEGSQCQSPQSLPVTAPPARLLWMQAGRQGYGAGLHAASRSECLPRGHGNEPLSAGPLAGHSAGLLARGQAHLHPIACSVFPGEPAPSTSIPEKTALDGLTVQSCDIQQTKEQGFLFLTSYHHLGTGPPGLPPPSDGGSCLQTVRANTCSRWVPATPCSPHGVRGLGSCTAEGLGTCPREPQVLGLCVPLGTTLHPPHQVLSGGTEHVL